MERRLVSILAVDAASYSRLVANDEDAALELFRGHSKLMTELFREYNGRLFGGAGDSLVAEFASPVEALRCAVKIQEQLAAANEELPDERRMHFRVGLNLGDAVVVEGNLFGEAVNVAARLEALAEPGGICVSASFHEQVKHLPDSSSVILAPAISRTFPFPSTPMPPRARTRAVWPGPLFHGGGCGCSYTGSGSSGGRMEVHAPTFAYPHCRPNRRLRSCRLKT